MIYTCKHDNFGFLSVVQWDHREQANVCMEETETAVNNTQDVRDDEVRWYPEPLAYDDQYRALVGPIGLNEEEVQYLIDFVQGNKFT